MGRGVMEPEYRGATARRLMRDAQANAALYAKDTERVMAQRDEARTECAALREKCKGAEIETALWKATAEVAQDEINRLTREEAAVPFLMDMIAEQSDAILVLKAELANRVAGIAIREEKIRQATEQGFRFTEEE